MAITVYLSRSPGLLNRGPGGPASLGHVPNSSIFTPTGLNFLLPGLYNNLTSTLLPATVTVSHSIQPLDSQGYILIFLDRMHLLFTQAHFLFWQFGRVGGQYTISAVDNFFDQRDISTATLMEDVCGSWWSMLKNKPLVTLHESVLVSPRTLQSI